MTPVVLAAPGTASMSSLSAYYPSVAVGASGDTAGKAVMFVDGDGSAAGGTVSPGYVLQSAAGGVATPSSTLQHIPRGAATQGYVIQGGVAGSAATPSYVIQGGAAASPGYVMQGATPTNYVLQSAAGGAANPGYVVGAAPAPSAAVPAYNITQHPATHASGGYVATTPYTASQPGYRPTTTYHQRATAAGPQNYYHDRGPQRYHNRSRPQYHNPTSHNRGYLSDDQTRLKRLRDYYIPSRAATAPMHNHHGMTTPHWPAQHPAAASQHVPATYPMQPPSYQQVANGCAWPAQPTSVVNAAGASQPVLLATTAR